MLLFLDLSAAFDTVNHQVLFSRLSDRFGIKRTALSCRFESYLQGRTQFVCINNSRSSCRDVMFGVPKDSTLGPFLYLLYTAPLGDILREYGVRFHMHADDTQLYMLSHLLLAILNAPVLFWSHAYVLLNVGYFIITLNSTVTRLNYSFFTLSIDLLLPCIL